jgi:hypothetical protein
MIDGNGRSISGPTAKLTRLMRIGIVYCRNSLHVNIVIPVCRLAAAGAARPHPPFGFRAHRPPAQGITADRADRMAAQCPKRQHGNEQKYFFYHSNCAHSLRVCSLACICEVQRNFCKSLRCASESCNSRGQGVRPIFSRRTRRASLRRTRGCANRQLPPLHDRIATQHTTSASQAQVPTNSKCPTPTPPRSTPALRLPPRRPRRRPSPRPRSR